LIEEGWNQKQKQKQKQSMRRRLNAREPEEPGAGKPHAGICEGGAEQSAFLP
jgi:hypothetical protein